MICRLILPTMCLAVLAAETAASAEARGVITLRATVPAFASVELPFGHGPARLDAPPAGGGGSASHPIASLPFVLRGNAKATLRIAWEHPGGVAPGLELGISRLLPCGTGLAEGGPMPLPSPGRMVESGPHDTTQGPLCGNALVYADGSTAGRGSLAAGSEYLGRLRITAVAH